MRKSKGSCFRTGRTETVSFLLHIYFFFNILPQLCSVSALQIFMCGTNTCFVCAWVVSNMLFRYAPVGRLAYGTKKGWACVRAARNTDQAQLVNRTQNVAQEWIATSVSVSVPSSTFLLERNAIQTLGHGKEDVRSLMMATGSQPACQRTRGMSVRKQPISMADATRAGIYRARRPAILIAAKTEFACRASRF